jgi:sugar lactone lactonase YvrE
MSRVGTRRETHMKTFVFRAAAGVALLLVAALLLVKLLYGGGKAYPDVSTPPLVAANQVATLVSLEFPPGNVSVAADGRIFFAYHPFAQAQRFGVPTVFELVAGVPRPFPDAEFQKRYQGVFGMTVDTQQRLWVIEPCGLDHQKTRLMAFDLKTRAVVFEHWFEAGQAQFAQDLRVSADGRTVILADTGLFKFTSPSLIVFDVGSKTYRKLLEQHPSARPQDWFIKTRHGPHRLGYGLVTFSVGLDGIEFSRDGRWLYYGSMSHDQLFKLPTAALLDATLSAQDLARQVVAVGRKPLSDGITVDAQDNVLITDVENGGIARLNTKGQLVTLTRSAQVVWADGVVMAPDGSVLFTDSAIPAYIDPLARPPSREKLRAAAPYPIYRFTPAD